MDKNSLCTLEVTQTSPNSPFYVGTCKTCDKPVSVVEAGAVQAFSNASYNDGLKFGVLKGIAYSALFVGTFWAINKAIKRVLSDD